MKVFELALAALLALLSLAQFSAPLDSPTTTTSINTTIKSTRSSIAAINATLVDLSNITNIHAIFDEYGGSCGSDLYSLNFSAALSDALSLVHSVEPDIMNLSLYMNKLLRMYFGFPKPYSVWSTDRFVNSIQENFRAAYNIGLDRHTDEVRDR